MASKLITTRELSGKRVVAVKGKKEQVKRIGKVRCCVFHPKEKRCIGFIVKRPDLLLMFHRKDLFVSLRGYDLEDGRIVVRDDPSATGQAACKDLGVDWDACVLWEGLPVMTADGESFGYVGTITFDRKTGEIDSFEVDTGVASNALLGTMTIPGDMIRGFRRGMGTALTMVGSEGEEQDNPELGALLVTDAVKELKAEGGAAEQAGKAVAVAASKVKPAASEAAHAAGEVVNKGAYATGRQISRASGMFSEFKSEYDKARGLKDDEGKVKAKAKKIERAEADDESDEEVAGTLDAAAAADEAAAATDTAAADAAGADADAEDDTADDELVLDAEPVERPRTSSSKKSSKKSSESASSKAGYAVGRQLSRAGGMFSEFKKEYDKARHDD